MKGEGSTKCTVEYERNNNGLRQIAARRSLPSNSKAKGRSCSQTEDAEGCAKEGAPNMSDYERPYPVSKLPQHLLDDPVHRWRAETGIELIHEEPTFEEFVRICTNWDLMQPQMKRKSDEKSLQFFGMNNTDHMMRLFEKYLASVIATKGE